MDTVEFSAGEQMLSEFVGVLTDLIPGLDLRLIKDKFSEVMTKYRITRSPENIFHPDVEEKMKLFLSAKKLEGMAESTIDGYKRELIAFAEHVKKRVVDITTADLRVFLASHDHVMMSTIAKKLFVLRSFFGWLTDEEIITRDPAKKIKAPKMPKMLPKALDIEGLEMLREACETERQRALLEFFYSTGCRLSEVQRLNIEDIDVQNMSTKVFGKGSKERIVYLSFRALYHLKKYLKSRDDDCPALFVTERKPSRRMGRRTIEREINMIASRTDISKKVTPHVMRHTFATLMLNNGADLAGVQQLLGHSSPDTTQRYATVTEENKHNQHRKYLVQ